MLPYLTFLLSLTFNIPATVKRGPVITPRIVNGYEVGISKVPYQASIHRQNESGWWYLCGAVIIHRQALLTAAHCLETLSNNLAEDYGNEITDTLKYVRISVGTSVIDSGGKLVNVSSFVMHHDYPRFPFDADIAFIILEHKMKFNKRINAIRCAPQGYVIHDGSEALISGFGTTSYNGHFSKVLLAANVYIIKQQVCASLYGQLATIGYSVICATATHPPRDACLGDSGGPLVANGYLIGLVSFGVGCAHSEYPGVYVRISYFYDWIETALVAVR